MLGVNDLPARDPRPDDKKVASCLANIQKALDLALEHFHPGAIILVAPPGIDAEGLDSVNRKKGYASVPPMLKQLEAGLEQLAGANGVQFVSLQNTLRPGQYVDGLHPNAEGDAAIAKALGEALPKPNPAILAGPLPAFYVIGDSISIDYHDALESECRGKYRYSRKGGLELARSDLDHPQGANGGDSLAVLAHLREALQKPGALPDTILINCGLHDIKVDPATSKNQVSLDDYRRNLTEIAGLLKNSGKRLVWITTTPVDEKRHNARSKAFHRYERDLDTYNAAAGDVMAAQGVPVIDLYEFTTKIEGQIFRDHVHFLPEVSRCQAGFLRPEIDKLPPMQDPDSSKTRIEKN